MGTKVIIFSKSFPLHEKNFSSNFIIQQKIGDGQYKGHKENASACPVEFQLHQVVAHCEKVGENGDQQHR